MLNEAFLKEAKRIYGIKAEKPLRIYDIFKHEFGEENVDFQSSLEEILANNNFSDITAFEIHLSDRSWPIIVHWPEVTVTNEYGESTLVRDLYAKILVRSNGRLVQGFQLVTTTYDIIKWNRGYMHSHLPSHRGCIYFRDPCLGTGPIRNTQNYLYNNSYNEHRWGLFAYELGKYVTVESIAGGPYIRMSSLHLQDLPYELPADFGALRTLKRFLNTQPRRFGSPQSSQPYLDGKLYDDMISYVRAKIVDGTLSIRINYKGNKFVLGEPFKNIAIKISNVFQQWAFNKLKEGYDLSTMALVRKGVLIKCVVNNDMLYTMGTGGMNDLSNIPTSKVLDFKGQPVYVTIVDENTDDTSYLLCLHTNYMFDILYNLLFEINLKYGKPKTKTEAFGKYIYA